MVQTYLYFRCFAYTCIRPWGRVSREISLQISIGKIAKKVPFPQATVSETKRNIEKIARIIQKS